MLVNVIDPVTAHVRGLKNIKRIGVIGTEATINSKVYAKKLARKGLTVKSLSTPLLAPMIEAGFLHNKISKTIISSYIENKDLQHIQALILACTHYPLIKKDIVKLFKKRINVIDAPGLVAAHVKQLLNKHDLLSGSKKKKHHFYVSDYTKSFEQTTRIFYKDKVRLEHYPIWDK